MRSPITRRSFLGTSMGVLASLALYGCSTTNTIPESTPTDEASSVEEQEGTEAAADMEYDDGTSSIITKPIDNGFSSGIHHATIEVEGFGTIKVELNANNSPISVSNFAQLANEEFYDGTTFHRILEGFMIQGGGYRGSGLEGRPRPIKGEFIENGVVNAIQHRRGVISMARGDDMDSASSQFFIMHADMTSIDGKYAAFGKVTEGMDVVDAIAKTPVQDDNGTVAADDQPKITSIRMDD